MEQSHCSGESAALRSFSICFSSMSSQKPSEQSKYASPLDAFTAFAISYFGVSHSAPMTRRRDLTGRNEHLRDAVVKGSAADLSPPEMIEPRISDVSPLDSFLGDREHGQSCFHAAAEVFAFLFCDDILLGGGKGIGEPFSEVIAGKLLSHTADCLDGKRRRDLTAAVTAESVC